MLFHILSFPFTRNIPNITQRASRHVTCRTSDVEKTRRKGGGKEINNNRERDTLNYI